MKQSELEDYLKSEAERAMQSSNILYAYFSLADICVRYRPENYGEIEALLNDHSAVRSLPDPTLADGEYRVESATELLGPSPFDRFEEE